MQAFPYNKALSILAKSAVPSSSFISYSVMQTQLFLLNKFDPKKAEVFDLSTGVWYSIEFNQHLTEPGSVRNKGSTLRAL